MALLRRLATILIVGFSVASASRLPRSSESQGVLGSRVSSSITWFMGSDSHFGRPGGPDMKDLNRRVAAEMIRIPGMEWPTELGGGLVDEPLAAVFTGDLVDNGCLDSAPSQWADFKEVFIHGLPWPVYEGFGNHDGGKLTSPEAAAVAAPTLDPPLGTAEAGGPMHQAAGSLGSTGTSGAEATMADDGVPDSSFHSSSGGSGGDGTGNTVHQNGATAWEHCSDYVRRAIQERNEALDPPHGRPHLASVSDNGLHYSWNWNQLHLVHLNLYPGNQHEHAQDWMIGPWQFPEYSLNFLARSLRENVGLGSHQPVVIFQHYGYDAYWSMLWWTDHERSQLRKVLEPYNVIAIFVGHTHVAQFYPWGPYDIFNSPSTVKIDVKRHGIPTFLVVQLDLNLGTFRVAMREGSGWGPIMFRKNITREQQGAPTQLVAAAAGTITHAVTAPSEAVGDASAPATGTGAASAGLGGSGGGSGPRAHQVYAGYASSGASEWSAWSSAAAATCRDPTVELTGREHAPSCMEWERGKSAALGLLRGMGGQRDAESMVES